MLLFGITQSFALSQQDYSGYSTERIQILKKGSLLFHQKEPFSFFKKTLQLSWTPEWDIDLIDEPKCFPDNFLSNLININNKEQLNLLQSLWRNCEPKLRKTQYNSVYDSLKMLSIDYSLLNHPFAHEVIFNLHNQQKVRGLFLINNSTQRDLVILRPGIYSSFQTMVAERFLVQTLFDEGQFNVLILPSTTGRQFINDNENYRFGALEEGLQTYLISKILNDPKEPFHQLISKINAVGISMGGHGLIVTNIIQSFFENQTQNIEKSIYFCPLINYDETKKNLNSSLLSSWANQYWNWMRLEPLRNKNNIRFSEFFKGDNWLQNITYPNDTLYFENLLNFISSVLHKDIQKTKPNNKSDLLTKLYDFAKNKKYNSSMTLFETLKNISQPYLQSLVFYTDVDPIVPPQLNILNSGDFFEKSIVLKLNKGVHCSVPVNYNHSFFSKIINGYLNPNLNSILNSNKKPITNSSLLRLKNLLNSNYKITNIYFLTLSEIKVELQKQNWLGSYDIQNLKLNKSDLDFEWSPDDIYKSQLKKIIRTRLNSLNNKTNLSGFVD